MNRLCLERRLLRDLRSRWLAVTLNLYEVASARLYVNHWHLIFDYILLMSLPLWSCS